LTEQTKKREREREREREQGAVWGEGGKTGRRLQMRLVSITGSMGCRKRCCARQ